MSTTTLYAIANKWDRMAATKRIPEPKNENKTQTKPSRLCEVCGRPLVKIGTARKNGKRSHGDWDTRKRHKKCL